jgi:proteic killer suppression protein
MGSSSPSRDAAPTSRAQSTTSRTATGCTVLATTALSPPSTARCSRALRHIRFRASGSKSGRANFGRWASPRQRRIPDGPPETEPSDFGGVRRLPSDIIEKTLNKLDVLNGANDLLDLRSPPGNRLEAVRGDLSGFYCIRVTNQWRLIFRYRCDVSCRHLAGIVTGVGYPG